MTPLAANWSAMLLALEIALGAFIAFSPHAASQAPQIDSNYTVESLQPAGAPALDILGLAPSSIPRAATPAAVKVLLLSALAHEHDLPRNFAVEVSPFWLIDRPALTFDEYFYAGPAQNALQSLTISAATAPLNGDQGVKMGLGARVIPIAGRPNPAFAQARNRLASLQDEFLTKFDQCDNAADPGNGGNGQNAGGEEPDCLSDPELRALLSQIQKAAEAIHTLDSERLGWHVEIDAGLRVDFPDGSIDESSLARQGLWIVPTYRTAVWTSPTAADAPAHYLDFSGIVRFLRDETVSSSVGLVDIGGSVLWKHDRFAAQGELVRRAGSVEHSSTRVSGLFQYQFDDDTYLIGSLGQDFKDPVTQKIPLIAHLGIQFHFGKKPAVKLP